MFSSLRFLEQKLEQIAVILVNFAVCYLPFLQREKERLEAFLRKGIIWILYGSAINVTDVILDLSWWQRKIRSLNLNFKAFMAFKCFNTLLVFVMTHNINKNC